jgi:hypothetical protein
VEYDAVVTVDDVLVENEEDEPEKSSYSIHYNSLYSPDSMLDANSPDIVADNTDWDTIMNGILNAESTPNTDYYGPEGPVGALGQDFY